MASSNGFKTENEIVDVLATFNVFSGFLSAFLKNASKVPGLEDRADELESIVCAIVPNVRRVRRILAKLLYEESLSHPDEGGEV